MGTSPRHPLPLVPIVFRLVLVSLARAVRRMGAVQTRLRPHQKSLRPQRLGISRDESARKCRVAPCRAAGHHGARGSHQSSSNVTVQPCISHLSLQSRRWRGASPCAGEITPRMIAAPFLNRGPLPRPTAGSLPLAAGSNMTFAVHKASSRALAGA